MKLVLIALLASISVAQASGIGANPHNLSKFESTLTKVDVDGAFVGNATTGGKLKIDIAAKLVALDINTSEGIITVQLPIVKLETNDCGTNQITAERNNYDGSRQALVIIDNSNSSCVDSKNNSPVEIEFQAESLRPRLSSRGFFEAQALVGTQR